MHVHFEISWWTKVPAKYRDHILFTKCYVKVYKGIMLDGPSDEAITASNSHIFHDPIVDIVVAQKWRFFSA